MFLLLVSLYESVYLQHSYAPVFSSPLSCSLETRQANKGHSGGDGQRSNVLQQDPRQTECSDTHLDQGRHNDSPLDLTEQRNCRDRKKKCLMKQRNFQKIWNETKRHTAAVLNYVNFESTTEVHEAQVQAQRDTRWCWLKQQEEINVILIKNVKI